MTITKPTRSMLGTLNLGLEDVENILASEAEAESGAGTGLMNASLVGAAIAALAGEATAFNWSDHAAFYTTGRSSPELRTNIPLSSTTRYPVLRVGPIPLTTNDLVIAWACAQFTTDETQYNTLITTQIILVDDSQFYGNVAASRELTDVNGPNITPAIHHDPQLKIGAIRAPANENAYLNFVARADTSSGSKVLVVDQDYGWMDCLVLKNFFAS